MAQRLSWILVSVCIYLLTDLLTYLLTYSLTHLLTHLNKLFACAVHHGMNAAYKHTHIHTYIHIYIYTYIHTYIQLVKRKMNQTRIHTSPVHTGIQHRGKLVRSYFDKGQCLLTYLRTYLFTNLFIYSLTHLRTYSLTHLLTTHLLAQKMVGYGSDSAADCSNPHHRDHKHTGSCTMSK